MIASWENSFLNANQLADFAPRVVNKVRYGVLASRISLHQRGNQRSTDGMEMLPSNMTPLAPFDGLPPLHKVDQTMMRRLRELADQRGWSVEHLLHEALEQWVAQCQVERELEAKIIRFPKRLDAPASHTRTASLTLPAIGRRTEGRSKKRETGIPSRKKGGFLLLNCRRDNPDEPQNFFTTRERIARPPDPSLDRFEHEHPESLAFPPHRMLDAIGYAKFYSRSHHAVIRVYDESGNVIATHEHADDFKEQ
jgi:hypothetical protein